MTYYPTRRGYLAGVRPRYYKSAGLVIPPTDTYGRPYEPVPEYSGLEYIPRYPEEYRGVWQRAADNVAANAPVILGGLAGLGAGVLLMHFLGKPQRKKALQYLAAGGAGAVLGALITRGLMPEKVLNMFKRDPGPILWETRVRPVPEQLELDPTRSIYDMYPGHRVPPGMRPMGYGGSKLTPTQEARRKEVERRMTQKLLQEEIDELRGQRWIEQSKIEDRIADLQKQLDELQRKK